MLYLTSLLIACVIQRNCACMQQAGHTYPQLLRMRQYFVPSASSPQPTISCEQPGVQSRNLTVHQVTLEAGSTDVEGALTQIRSAINALPELSPLLLPQHPSLQELHEPQTSHASVYHQWPLFCRDVIHRVLLPPPPSFHPVPHPPVMGPPPCLPCPCSVPFLSPPALVYHNPLHAHPPKPCMLTVTLFLILQSSSLLTTSWSMSVSNGSLSKNTPPLYSLQ